MYRWKLYARNVVEHHPSDAKLIWNCRRGMLELDLMLARFVEQRLPLLSPTERLLFARLLDYPDPVLYALLMGQVELEEEDTTIARALLGIYNRTGRIIIDASIPGNLIVTAENKVVCVDVGMALILEEKEDDCLHRYARRKSIVSNEAWELVHRDGIDERILKDNKSELPKTLMTTRALLFIRTHRPDISNVDFLNNDPSLLEKLSKAYNSEIKDDAIQLLEDKQPVSLSGVKYACTQALQKYIDSRGSMDENRKFSASRLTKWFRNEVAVRRKVDCAEKLIGKINQARSIVEIESALNDTSHNPSFSKGWMSGFMRCIGLCRVITQVQQSHELTTQITPLHRS